MMTASVVAAARSDGSAASLRASYASMRQEIERSAFDKPLKLVSSNTGDSFAGEIYAVVDFPFDSVHSQLRNVRSWCEILILHPNIEQCRIAGAPHDADASISVDVGRAQVPVTFSYQVVASAVDFLDVRLGAAKGPLGTTDYRIELEAAPLEARRTILHLSFSHGYGTRARYAMKAYLATFGRDKVGFTEIARGVDGKPRYVGDFRGALERNAMRYYLAIEAYLASLSAPVAEQREARLRTFFSYTQRYSRQLHEEDEYLERKRAQFERQPAVS